MDELEQAWKNDVVAREHVQELLNVWAGRKTIFLKRKNFLLRSFANSEQLALALPDYIRERRNQLTFSETINHAFSIAREVGHARAAGLAILGTILELATLEKKSGNNMSEAHRAIIDVYFFAPPGSEMETKACALTPTTEEYREDIASIRLQKFGDERPVLDMYRATQSAPEQGR